MNENTFFDYLNLFWFTILPYVALFTFFIATIQRYRGKAFTYSSLSSQFLENKVHFWAMVPFHYGILTVLFGHLIGFLCPAELLAWNSEPIRLYIFEVTGFIAAIFTLVGLLNIIIRRTSNDKIRMVTSTADWIVIAIIMFQVVTGIYTAIFHSWGSSWFASSMAPYLWSIVQFSPEIAYVTPLPIMTKLHIINAYILITIFPFTRLVHILVVPNPYLWRKTQLVRWHWNRKTIRTTDFKIDRK